MAPTDQNVVTCEASALEQVCVCRAADHLSPTMATALRNQSGVVDSFTDCGHRVAKMSVEQHVPQPWDAGDMVTIKRRLRTALPKENHSIFISPTEKQKLDVSAAILFSSE